jgi:hypothetical protein
MQDPKSVYLMQSAIDKDVICPEQRRMVSYESEADFRYDNRYRKARHRRRRQMNNHTANPGNYHNSEIQGEKKPL